MNSTNVSYICQEPKFFSLQEAQALVPLFQFITDKHEKITVTLIKQQQYLVKCKAPDSVIQQLQDLVNKNYVHWGTKITKLGGKALMGGAVGIDAGGYYWSWFYNDKKIEHYHMYSESPGHRRHLSVYK